MQAKCYRLAALKRPQPEYLGRENGDGVGVDLFSLS